MADVSSENTKAAPWNTYLETLKRTLDGEFDGASEERKARAVEDVIRTSSAAASVVALQPFPFVDSALVLPIQRRMVEGVERIHRSTPGRDHDHVASEIFKPLRRDFLGPHLAMAGGKLIPIVPFIGDLITVSVAYALTCAIGELSDRYFRAERVMAPSEMRCAFNLMYRETFERTYKNKRNELLAVFRRNPEVRRQIEDLKRARRDGTVGRQEAERMLDDILRGRAL